LLVAEPLDSRRHILDGYAFFECL